MLDILVLHGPNLNLLGSREPQIYGEKTLSSLNQALLTLAFQAGYSLECEQHNAEGALIDSIHQAKNKKCRFIIFNPAAYTHTSIALRDALLGVDIPFIEVHLSNPHAREAFRHASYFSDIALGVIYGLGIQSYELALTAACQYLDLANRIN